MKPRKEIVPGKEGFQKVYTGPYLKKILKKMRDYIDANTVPIMAEFAYQNDIPLATFYEVEELSAMREMLILKKQANLEKGALTNQINPAMAIFSLKQMGWRDKPDETDTSAAAMVEGMKAIAEKLTGQRDDGR